MFFFFFYIENKGEKAFLQYDYITSNKVELYHTLVPPSYRGHGVAGILAEAWTILMQILTDCLVFIWMTLAL